MATDGTSRTAHTAKVNLPFVSAEFRTPELHMPHVSAPGRKEINAALLVARSYLPTPKQAVYYGGLGLMAAFELLEWPVAVAIGLGTALAGHAEGDRSESSGEKEAGTPATQKRAAPARKPRAGSA